MLLHSHFGMERSETRNAGTYMRHFAKKERMFDSCYEQRRLCMQELIEQALFHCKAVKQCAKLYSPPGSVYPVE